MLVRAQLAVAAPASIRAAVWAANETARARFTTSALDERQREMSARTVLTGAQGFVLALMFCAIIAVVMIWPKTTLVITHVALSLLFLSVTLLRLVAAALGKRPPPPSLSPQDKLPIYTVLVALKDEEEVARDLLSQLPRKMAPHPATGRAGCDTAGLCGGRDQALAPGPALIDR